MFTRGSPALLTLLAMLTPATHAQNDKPEIVWQFEAGG